MYYDDSDLIDFSIGNPRHAFSAASKHALKLTSSEMNSYIPSPNAPSCSGDIIDYLSSQMHLSRPGWTGIGRSSIVMTHGTTQGYDKIVTLIATHCAAYRDLIGNTALKPVFIMPTPTYGLFDTAPRKNSFEIVNISRDPSRHFLLDPNDIANTLHDIRKDKNLLAVGYFDSNPHNPSGNIRTRHETDVLTDIFLEHNAKMLEQTCDHASLEKRARPHIHIIDDMVYDGLEYDAQNKPISFMCNPEFYDSAYLLLGISKIGLPALRGGLVICNFEDATDIQFDLFDRECQLPLPSMKALQYSFSTDPEALYERQKHLDKLRQAHIFGEKLMRSMIDGIDAVSLSQTERKRLLETVACVIGNKHDARNVLREGMPELDVLTRPESGFFHLVQMNDKHRIVDNGYLIQQDLHLASFFDNCGVQTLPGCLCGFKEEDNILRLSFSLPPKDIVRGCLKMKAALEKAHL